MGDDEAVSQLIERYEDALVYTVIDDCYYRGCKMAGLGIMVEERDLIGMMVFDCRNEDAAFDAENDIEDILEDRIEALDRLYRRPGVRRPGVNGERPSGQVGWGKSAT